MRKFEKISLDTFHKAYSKHEDDYYNNLKLPVRGSKYSAGYDIYLPWDVDIKAHDTLTIPTLLKVCMNDDEVVLIDVRSSLGFNHNIRLANTIGVIDKDYYNNTTNEGHIMIKLYNPNDYDVHLYEGDRFAQAIFINYLKTDDDSCEDERVGGIGSTNK